MLSTAWEHRALSTTGLGNRVNCSQNHWGSVGERKHSGKDKPSEGNHKGKLSESSPDAAHTAMQQTAGFSPSSVHVCRAFGGKLLHH